MSIPLILRLLCRRACRAAAAVAFVAFGIAGTGSAQTTFPDIDLKNLSAYAAMIRKDLRAEKRTLISESIGLPPNQANQFWNVYEQYEKEFAALWDIRVANTKNYVDRYDHVTEADADVVARTLLQNESRLCALRTKYYRRFKSTVGARLAARFLHVEGALNRVLELHLLAQLPLIP